MINWLAPTAPTPIHLNGHAYPTLLHARTAFQRPRDAELIAASALHEVIALARTTPTRLTLPARERARQLEEKFSYPSARQSLILSGLDNLKACGDPCDIRLIAALRERFQLHLTGASCPNCAHARKAAQRSLVACCRPGGPVGIDGSTTGTALTRQWPQQRPEHVVPEQLLVRQMPLVPCWETCAAFTARLVPAQQQGADEIKRAQTHQADPPLNTQDNSLHPTRTLN